jgi:hypothetical protein
VKVAVVAHAEKTLGGGLPELRRILEAEGVLDRKVRYELDGGDRSKVRSFKIKVEPEALGLCVPRPGKEEER